MWHKSLDLSIFVDFTGHFDFLRKLRIRSESRAVRNIGKLSFNPFCVSIVGCLFACVKILFLPNCKKYNVKYNLRFFHILWVFGYLATK